MSSALAVSAPHALFPLRVPEPSEPMTPGEQEAFAAWTASPVGRGLYAALAAQAHARLGRDHGRVVSVGEGDGAFARALAARAPGLSIVGVDVAPEAVARARASGGPPPPALRFEVGSAYDLAPFGPADAVVCVLAFHHLHAPARAVAAARAALAPGGVLWVLDLRRDADCGAYLRTLAAYEAEGAALMGRLFDASVRAAHTRDELAGLLPGARVAPARLVPAARAALAAHVPDAGAAAAIAADAEGLWVEALLRADPAARGGG